MAADGLHRESHESGPNFRNGERRRYFFAGVVSCLVAQLLIVGGFVVTRYGIEAMRHRAPSVAPTATSAPALTDPAAALPLPVAAARAPEAAVEETTETAVSTVAEKSDAAEGKAAPESAVEKRPAVVQAPPAAPTVTARPVNPSPLATARSPRPPGQLPAQQPVTSSPEPARPPLTGPADWAESQAEVRAALERWLIIEDRDDVRFAEAEVILNPDGDTAKTRVPTTRGGGRIVEQRWQRQANGWVMLDVREIAAGKQ